MLIIDCYYCKSKNVQASSEHIIPNFMGCNYRVNNYMCITCNNTFGNTFEKEVAKTFNFVRVLFNLLDSAKKEPPPEKGILAEDGKLYDLFPDGNFQASKPECIENENDNFTYIYRSIPETKKHLPKILNKDFKNLDISNSRTFLNFKFNFNFPPEFIPRLIAKSTLNIIARNMPDLLKISEIKEISEFVNSGKNNIVNFFIFDLLNELPKKKLGILDNYISVNYLKKESCLRTVFVFFGHFHYMFELPLKEKFNQSFSLVLHHDPISGKTIEKIYKRGKSLSAFKDNASLIDKNEYLSILKKRFIHLMELHRQHYNEKNIQNIINNSMNKALGTPDGRLLTTDDLLKLANITSEKFVNWKYKIPLEKKLNIKPGDNVFNEDIEKKLNLND